MSTFTLLPDPDSTKFGEADERIDQVSAVGPAAEVAICRVFLKAREARL